MTTPTRKDAKCHNGNDESIPITATESAPSSTPLVVDTHSHMYYPSYMDVLRQRTRIPKVVKHPETGEDRLIILPNEERGSSLGRPCPPDFYDVDKKLEYMDVHGIDVSVISLANPWLNFLDEEEEDGGASDGDCLATANGLNADLHRMCGAANEGRGRTSLLGFGVVPTVRNVEGAAVPALRRFEGMPNLRGIIVGTTGIAGEGLDSELMEPVYGELERQNLVLFVHPHYGLKGENLTTDSSRRQDYGHSLELALGFPFETSIAISKLVLSGVLDRYPRLKVLVAHAGGALPWLHGRLDSCSGYERGKGGTSISKLKKHPPTEYLKDLYYDAIIYDSANLEKLVGMVGADRVTFGTDHPFFPPVSSGGGSGKKWESCTKVQQTVLEQGREVSNHIFGGTAAELFGLTNDYPSIPRGQTVRADLVQSYGYFASSREIKKSHPVEQFEIISPVTNEAVFVVAKNTVEEVNGIIESSHETYLNSDWSTNKLLRLKLLTKASNVLRSPEVLDKLANLEVRQIGRPFREMRFQLGRLHEWFDYYASVLRVHEDRVVPFGAGNATDGNYLNYVTREPLGVVGLITPWNHPLLITIKKLAPALACGNTVIIKPSELAPCSVLEFIKLLLNDDDEAYPKNVISVIQGDGTIGKALVRHPLVQKIDFTGGPETFREIGADAGRNLVSYTSELGGKSPMVVFSPGPGVSDSPVAAQYVERIVNNVIFGCFVASGQTCIAGTRLILQENDDGFHEKVVDSLVKKVQRLKVGDPFEEGTDLGPVVSKKQLEFIDSKVSSVPPHVSILCGGKKVIGKGNLYEPTVLLVSNADQHPLPDIFYTELFGPVLTVVTAKTDQELINLANASDYSLGCSIWSQNLSQAHAAAKKVRSGIVWINDHHKNDPSSPWGGLSKMSGVNRENGMEAFLNYSQPKSVVMNLTYSEDEVGLCADNKWFSSCRGEGENGESARYN